MATPTPITSITLNRNSSEDITPQIPEHLYAYTDPNASGEKLYAWTWATGNETYYTKTSALASNTPLYDKDSEAIGSISGLIIDDNKFSSDINYVFTNTETLSILTNLYNDDFISIQANGLEDFIATILGLQPSDISLDNLQFVLNEVTYTNSIESNITYDFYGINLDSDYYFSPNSADSSNGLALFLFLGTDRVFFIGYFNDAKIDVSKYGSEEVKTAMSGFLIKEIRTQIDFHRVFLDTQSGDIATGYLGIEVTDETFDSESGSLSILAGDKGNTLLYCFDANSPWTDGADSLGTTALIESSSDFGELTSDSYVRITNEYWRGSSSIFDLIEFCNTHSYNRDVTKDIIITKTLYSWTAPSGTGLFYYDSSYNQIQIADNTIYTTTSTIDTSTRTFYLEDGTSISLYNLWIPGSTTVQSGSTINSATSSEISIYFED